MFYAGDGVYDFQYLEYLDSKYKYDSEWLSKSRGFDIAIVREIISQTRQTLITKAKRVSPINVKDIFPEVAKQVRKKLKGRNSTAEIKETERKMLISSSFYRYVKLFPMPGELERDNSEGWRQFYSNLLDLFTIVPSDFKNIDHSSLNKFLENFSFAPECNETYEGPGHFNILNSRPFIKFEGERYFLPIYYLITEAVYESPFYWMWDDKQYRDTLAKHRGEVGEEIAYDFLSKVFGKDNTFRSIIIESQKGHRETDIDVLCLLGNKALCVQVKSKKLTLTARRGDFDQLQKDFNGSVQDAYNQGLISRDAILNRSAKFIDKGGNEIFLPDGIDEVYIMGLTTENYPSLVHQVHLMLVKEKKNPYPLFLSVFDLELLVHYLSDPYDFLYYVRQRIELIDYFVADEELVYLGYHLKCKLWRIEGFNGGMLNTDFGALIDRNYYPYKLGISHLLTKDDDPIDNKWKDDQFDSLVTEIKLFNHPKTTDIIFHLLDWSGDSRKDIVNQLTKLKHISQIEGIEKSIATSTYPNFGMSYIVSNSADPEELCQKVATYGELRKYLTKCNAWLAMGSFSASPNLIDFMAYNDENWKVDLKLENEYQNTLTKMKKTPFEPIGNNKKVGRNDPCPCGSGKKYKRCCGR
jgi:hypothetical protein